MLAALSCVSSFFGPAQSVTIRSHVPPHGLMSANALMQMAMMGMRVIGPAAAGALVAAFGATICYSLDFVSFLGSAALIGSVAIVRPPAPPRAGRRPTAACTPCFHDMGEGMRFIVHHAALSFVVMAMAAGLFVIGCFGPLIADLRARVAARELGVCSGIVSAMVGVGMMAGMPVVRRLVEPRSRTARSCWPGSPASASARCCSAPCPGSPTALLGYVHARLHVRGVIVPAQTLMQRETPHALMGRISSTVMSVVFFAQLLGLVLSGLLAQLFGVRAVFFLCAVLAWVLTASGWLLLKSSSQPGPVADGLKPGRGRTRITRICRDLEGPRITRMTRIQNGIFVEPRYARLGGHTERQDRNPPAP